MIGNATYQAEEGMTWAEWVDSGYNINQEYFISSSGRDVINKNSFYKVTKVTGNTMIKGNTNYGLMPADSGGMN